MVERIGVAKTGNIASSAMLELLLDERADRLDIEVRVFTSGAKMDAASCEEAAKKVLECSPDLILYSTPNPSAEGPAKAIEIFGASGRKTIVIGDAPGIRIKKRLEELKLGYVFIKGDSMIGARREFLDPVEMAIFNADMIQVLSVSGAFRLLQEELNRAIKDKNYIPRVIVDSEKVVEYSGLVNEYAKAKAMAAYEIAEKVGEIDVKACFTVKERERYIPLVASAHELMRCAARLAGEAREIEKSSDAVLRKPHSKDGRILEKRKLMETFKF